MLSLLLLALLQAGPTGPRVATLDSARATASSRVDQVLAAIATQDSWSRDEVQAGFAFVLPSGKKLADTGRAMLVEAEAPLAPLRAGNSVRVSKFEGELVKLQKSSATLFATTQLKSSFTKAEATTTFTSLRSARDAFGSAARHHLVDADVFWALPDLTTADLAGAKLQGQQVAWITGHSGGSHVAPAWLNDSKWVCDNAEPNGWMEHGPKWFDRAYDTEGVTRNLVVFRSGDWTVGREGHGCYENVFRSRTWVGCRMEQCGGQAWQIVWRKSETGIPEASWDHANHTLRWEDCSAIDCGAINAGDAVRASWPVSIYNPGQKVEILRLKVRTRLPAFGNGGNMGHGGLFIGPAASSPPTNPNAFNDYGHTPTANVVDLEVEVWKSDREEVRLWNVGVARLVSPRLVDHTDSAACKAGTHGVCEIGDVSVVDDVGRLEIVQTELPLRVRIHSKSKPYGSPTKTIAVPAGGSLTWP